MVELEINGKKSRVARGTTLIEAARGMGINIPSLCYMEKLPHFTSCMICVVKDSDTGRLLPSCSSIAESGMKIDTESEEVFSARKKALELLLSEHVGDCEAPCRRGCPANMNIPLVFRNLEAGNSSAATDILKEHLPFPYTICSNCTATCEKVCRRGREDYAVEIRDINRALASARASSNSFEVSEDKNIAVIGSGAAGISAAWYLLKKGYRVEIFEKESRVAPSLRSLTEDIDLSVVENELNELEKQSGLKISCNREIETGNLEAVLKEFDAVVVATGDKTETENERIYFAGASLKPGMLLPAAILSGAGAAEKIAQNFSNSTVEVSREFDSKISKPEAEEIKHMIEKSEALRETAEETDIIEKSSRCMHCECLRQESCSLRSYATEYGIKSIKYRAVERHSIVRNTDHPEIVYEPGKCIRCGICVRITGAENESGGVAFKGRGYDTIISPALNYSLNNAITESLEEVVKNCPTGAFSFRTEGVRK